MAVFIHQAMLNDPQPQRIIATLLPRMPLLPLDPLCRSTRFCANASCNARKYPVFKPPSWEECDPLSDSALTRKITFEFYTVYVVQGQPDANVRGGFRITGLRSVALGDCDPALGYTGPLSNPPPISNGDKGCGFAYGDIWWDTSSYEQQSAILNLDHPLGDDAELHLDVNITQSDSAFRYAPSVGVFSFRLTDDEGNTNQRLLDAINAAAGGTIADSDDRFAVGHRFVAHGNRDWVWDTEEYDISLGITGRLAENLGYDARIDAWRFDSFLTGNTLVHGPTIQDAVREGRYDLVNPLSPFPGGSDENRAAHLDAIRDSSLREEQNLGAESLSARFALEGSGFAVGGRDVAWTAGVELGAVEAHQLLRFRDNAR